MRRLRHVPRALVLVALALPGCSSGGDDAASDGAPAAPPPAPSVVVADVTRADVPVVREFVARTEAQDAVVVQARVEALLTAMEFEEGRRVTAGQVLYRLDPRTYEANLSAARAELARAEADLRLAREQVSVRAAEAALDRAVASLGKARQDVARLRPLAEQDAVPRQDLDTALAAEEVAEADVAAAEAELQNSRTMEEVGVLQAEAQLESAEAAVALAELDLEYCTITSPIDGLIGLTQVDVGNLVGRGSVSELVTVSSIDPMRVTFSISEAEYLQFARRAPGEGRRGGDGDPPPLELILADDSVYAHPGETLTTKRAVSLETGTLTIVAVFPNPDGTLRPGQFGRVRTRIELLEDAVLVPQRAVMEQQGAKVVYVVGDDGVVALRTVQLSERHEGSYVVVAGLEGGERVIVEGQLKARPGSPVTPADAPASREPEDG